MVALHLVSADAQSFDSSIADDDLVIALDPQTTIDETTAGALQDRAEHLDADAWFADAEIDGHETRRPAWSPTRLLADPTACSPLAVRARWLRANDVGAGDPCLALRLAAERATVAHLPAVLTRHRTAPRLPDATDVTEHLQQIGLPAAAAQIGDQFALTPDPDFAPAVSAVIPTAGATVAVDGDEEVAIDRLLASLGPIPDRIEVIVVVGDEFRGDSTRLRERATVVQSPPGPFNFAAAVNRGLLHTHHDLVLMLNDDMEADGIGFIDQMALHLCDSTVAAVGARLLYPDGTIQHAGLVIDDARPLHSFVGWDPAATAPYGGDVARDVAAATGGCLMIRRRDFLAVGGLSTGFPLSFNDVDLCIRLRRAVGRVVIEPAATLLHHETLTRRAESTLHEWDRWISRWGEIVDPWYHPGHHRPDDPDRLNRNADHLEPTATTPTPDPVARTTHLRSIVHRGRLAPAST